MKIKLLTGEIWKAISNSNNEYFVSNMCRVKSIKNGEENLIRIHKQKNNYRRITISVDGKITNILFHRIMAILFIPNPENLPCVCHIDDDPSNCKLNNLEWGSYSHNTTQAYRTGRMNKKGTKNHMNKLSESEVLEIHGLDLNYQLLAKQYGISKGTVADIKQGLRWAWLTGGKSALRKIRGEKSRSNLTEQVVMLILNEKGTLAQISKKYGISGTTAWDIKNGKSWGWLTGITYTLKNKK